MFWKLEVENQVFSRTIFPLKLMRKNPSFQILVFTSNHCSLACRYIIPISLLSRGCVLPACFYVSFPPLVRLQSYWIRVLPHSSVMLINQLYLQQPYFQKKLFQGQDFNVFFWGELNSTHKSIFQNLLRNKRQHVITEQMMQSHIAGSGNKLPQFIPWHCYLTAVK